MKVLRVMLKSSGVGLLAHQDKAAEDLLALRRVHGETAQVPAQVAKEAFAQVGGAHAVPPARRPAQQSPKAYKRKACA